MRIFRVTIIAFAVLAAAAPALAHAQEPVLGSPDYANGSEGFGTARPAALHNGGSPGGSIRDIEWQEWGGPTARGTAVRPLYKPGGGYYSAPGRVQLRADKLANCSGSATPAYTRLRVRSAQWPGSPLGPWTLWSKTTCKWDPPMGRQPGYCADVGGKGIAPNTTYSIVAYRIRCRPARAAMRTLRRKLLLRLYLQGSGCRGFRVRALRCDVTHKRGEREYGVGRILRIACRSGKRNITAFATLQR